MSQVGRRFALSNQPGYGVSCGATGVFVGAVPLLESCRNCGGFQKWRPRPLDEINRDLSRRYGVPVEFGAKIEGLVAIARALDRGDLLHAHIATLHLEIPDPPALTKGAQSTVELVALAKELSNKRNAREGLGPTETSALAGRKSRQYRGTLRTG